MFFSGYLVDNRVYASDIFYSLYATHTARRSLLSLETPIHSFTCSDLKGRTIQTVHSQVKRLLRRLLSQENPPTERSSGNPSFCLRLPHIQSTGNHLSQLLNGFTSAGRHVRFTFLNRDSPTLQPLLRCGNRCAVPAY